MSISHRRDEVIRNGRNRKPRPKTFKSEQQANAYAKENSISGFEIKNLKSMDSKKKKLVIVQK